MFYVQSILHDYKFLNALNLNFVLNYKCRTAYNFWPCLPLKFIVQNDSQIDLKDF